MKREEWKSMTRHEAADVTGDDTYTTGGEKFRIPAHPDMVAALGRALWNFLSLEETVVAILYEGRHADLGKARAGMAGQKEGLLKELRDRLGAEGAPCNLLEQFDEGIDAFAAARRDWRNVITHAHPFTVGYEEDGTYLPGLGYTNIAGERTVAVNAADLLEIAKRIEDSSRPLHDLRKALREFADRSAR
jgi:hypothetical protein